MIKRVLTVAGSDSGGGAGIQADLKTFAAHGVHGMSAITCITAQNTEKVTAIQPLPAEVVREQIRVVVEDIGVDAVKTGMLFSSEIIEAVAAELCKVEAPLVVDPVFVAKSGARLLEEDAVEALTKKLFPLATVITPNIEEAKHLTGLEINCVDDMVAAAERLAVMGPAAVVVKGGHLKGHKTVDVLLYMEKVFQFEVDRVDTKNTHGTGCTFASAIAANLAKGYKIPQAVKLAQKFVTEAVLRGLSIGGGYGPVNPTGRIYEQAMKMEALINLREALQTLLTVEEFRNLIPESGSNFVVAVEGAKSIYDFASIPGRIVKTPSGFKPVSEPWFGASSHVARALLTCMRYDPSVRSAINIKIDEKILHAFEEANFLVSSYDRSQEPEEVKKEEGRTIPWGVEEAVKKVGGVPDIVYHFGDVGKEPMAIIFGQDAFDVVRKTVIVAKKAFGGQT